jgi:hypothetical protein
MPVSLRCGVFSLLASGIELTLEYGKRSEGMKIYSKE